MALKIMLSLMAFLVFFAVSDVSAHHPTVEAGLGKTGPIYTISPTTLPKGRWIFSLQLEALATDPFSDGKLKRFAADGEDVHTTDSIFHTLLGVSYGITDDFTLGLNIPYIYINNVREAHGDEPDEVHRHGDSDGIGDLTVFGQYRFFEADEYESSLLFGLKLPTGNTHVKDVNEERFDMEFQAGSGSWDPMIGIAAGKRFGRLSLDTSLLYLISTEGAQNTDLGDSFTYNAALSYRAMEKVVAWDLILEANGQLKQKQQINGDKDGNSGGHSVFISPGTRITWNNRWFMFFSLSLPVIQDLNGIQNDIVFKAQSGVGVAF